jgi:predicted HNH restriction endonuclease
MWCGKGFYKAPSLQIKQKYLFCSQECMGKYWEEYRVFAGENNGNYIGSYDKHKKYYGENWRKQRREARKRDNYKCVMCGITEEEYGMELSVHHIIPFVAFDDYREANKLSNLISVCESCHRKIHSGENHPSKFKEKYNL